MQRQHSHRFSSLSTYILFPVMLLLLAGIQKTPTEQKGRLPNNYGKVGLTEVQKKKIYDIQAKYKLKIEDLEKQLQDLKDKQEKEIHGVLTTAQAKLLHEMEISNTSKNK